KAEPDSQEARLGWAGAAMFLEDFADAARSLEEGLDLAPGAAPYRAVLSEVYVAWVDALGRRPAVDGAERVRLLEEGRRRAPGLGGLRTGLGAVLARPGPEADRARAALRSLLASGKNRGLVHLTLGMDAWQRGQKGEARVHLEEAFRQAPHLPVVANNLA